MALTRGSHKRQYNGRTNLRKAALKRKADAWALLECGKAHARGAIYLGGYAIECKLKAIAMEVYSCWTLDQLAKEWKVDDKVVYAHGLESLAKRLPLYDRFSRSSVWKDFSGHVNRWKPSWRYDPKPYAVKDAKDFLDAVGRVYKWLESNQC